MGVSGSNGRFHIALILLVVFCLIIVIGMQTATFYHQYFRTETTNSGDTGSTKTQLPENVTDIEFLYKGQFFTRDEIEEHVLLSRGLSNLSVNTPLSDLEMIEVSTCCCIIKSRFVHPDVFPDIHRVNRTLVRIGNRKQFFYTQICEPIPMDNCDCIALPVLSTAVYWVDKYSDRQDVGKFYFGNLCFSVST